MIIPMLEIYTCGGEVDEKSDDIQLLLSRIEYLQNYNLTKRQYKKICRKFIKIYKKKIKGDKKTIGKITTKKNLSEIEEYYRAIDYAYQKLNVVKSKEK